MYDGKLLQNNFFQSIQAQFRLLKLETVLDSLTKVLLRKYILDYAKFLIAAKIPFSLQIVDLDNFKLVNDNYGHQLGDEVLKVFAERLVESVGDRGLVGRYGGDEFIVILPYVTEYNDVYASIKQYFQGNAPMRTWYHFPNFQIFLTATIGSASFPQDSQDFDDLFLKSDKALYRGKTKGRNCFIVYVDSKHKNIDVCQNNKKHLNDIFFEIARMAELASTFEDKINKVSDYIIDTLKFSNTLFFEDDSQFKGIDSILDKKRFFSSNRVTATHDASETLYDFCMAHGILSVLVHKVVINGINYGYLVFTETKIERIWQDEDLALMLFISKILFI